MAYLQQNEQIIFVSPVFDGWLNFEGFKKVDNVVSNFDDNANVKK